MPSLPLPLKCYDEAGVIKPPVWLYTLLLINSIDWLIFVFALVSMQHTTLLLKLFYPQPQLLGLKLIGSVPFILVLLLIGNRQRLWTRQWFGWLWLLKPLGLLGVIASSALVLQQLLLSHWQFHAMLAAQLVSLVLLLWSGIKSLHIKHMLADWNKRTAA
ncbi:DUF2919 family protein [Salinimonas marina]|uniref:DUF2919 family protein n=1 Tax=Salinimonas marina TaxID=2785918 RepID=A0A7S9HC09_9ALTE|nr:DUF2919 family protein [Salinimonas marina]QPG04357.1 DUF2919 family protein [Salinimonas marina]